MKDISVVIPVYNRAQLITETLQSVENQSLQPLEVVIVDDYSTDETCNVVRAYAQRSSLNIRLLTNQRKKGACGAINHGILSSKGEYIAFLDSDDIWTPVHLQQVRQAIDTYGEAGVAFSGAEVFGDAKDVSEVKVNVEKAVRRSLSEAYCETEQGVWLSNEELFCSMAASLPFRVPASLVRKSLLIQHSILFDEDIEYTWDAHFLTIASYYTRFVYVDRTGLKIRRHAENDGNVSYGLKIPNGYRKRYRELMKFANEKGLDREARKKLAPALYGLQLDAFEYEMQRRPLLKRIGPIIGFIAAVPSWSGLKAVVKNLLRPPLPGLPA